MTANSSPVAAPDRTMVLTRTLDAPRELVFEAWTDPIHIARWFGPNGFTTTVHEMDVRPGGVWRFVMHGPDGTDFDNRVSYIEVTKPERLVYNHDSGEDDDPGRFHVTVTFDQIGNQTRLTMTVVLVTAAAFQRASEFGAIEAGNQTLGRLAQYLTSIKR